MPHGVPDGGDGGRDGSPPPLGAEGATTSGGGGVPGKLDTGHGTINGTEDGTKPESCGQSVVQ